MNNIIVSAPAKINLFLRVLGKRGDGYHNIYSWFQAINLFDRLAFEKYNGKTELTIEGDKNLPTDKENLVIQAARLMFDRFNLPGGLKILLKKNIPIAAGLGGGSSDAASAIYAIDKLFSLNLSDDEMMRLGLRIGSDLPFFFSSGSTEVTGRGEKLGDISLPLKYHIILLIPDLMISTAESYANLKLGLTILGPDIKLSCPNNFGDLIDRLKDIGNDFENMHLESYPVLDEMKDALHRTGAVITRMSGSGPTIFGLFEDMPEREDLQRITRGDWQAFAVRPITLPAWDQEGL